MRLRVFATALVIALAVCPAPGLGSAPGASSLPLQIDPAKTRVGLSRVKLRISDAQLDDEGLTATYHYRNRFLEPNVDAGGLQLRSDQPLQQLLDEGGTLMGRAHSSISGRQHVVHCQLRPDGTMRIDFRMGHRIMTFETRYRLGS